MKLTLRSLRGHEPVVCVMQEHKQLGQQQSSYQRITLAKHVIYSDVPYTVSIDWQGMDRAPEINLYMNGKPLAYVIEHEDDEALSISFKTRDCPIGDIFRDCYGYIQLEVECLWPDEMHSARYFSDYFGVMLRANKANAALQKMAEYVYRVHDRFIWKRNALPNIMAEIHENSEKSLDVQIELIKMVVQIYEHNLPYFKINPHTRAEHSYIVDDFSKLQQITTKTLQYIAQHPDELSISEVDTGIRLDKQYYYPRKTMIMNAEQSRATYENRAIMGFLHGVIIAVQDLTMRIHEYINKRPENPVTADGYIASSVFILETTKHHLKNRHSEIVQLADRLNDLYWVYKQFMPFDDSPLTSIPKATAVFMTLSQYRQVYDVMVKWYTFGCYDLSRELFMLPLLINHQLYEYYVLLKISCAIEEYGFCFCPKTSTNFLYPTPDPRYKPVDHINTFVFRGLQDDEITLYYQPVIWGQRYSSAANNAIKLRRTTSIALNGKRIRTAFYTPDYVLKYSKNGEERYLIIDAKLQSKRTVTSSQILDLSFKYQFSIKAAEETAHLIGVLILYGKTIDEASSFESVHDIYNEGCLPDFWIASLTESDICTEETQKQMFITAFSALSNI